MKNTDIFSPIFGYDMVVAVTEGTINEQLAYLADLGTIKTSLIMGLERKSGFTYTPVFYDTWDKVPKTDDGKTPKNPVINVEYFPSITIPRSGTLACLLLNMKSGTAWFKDPINLDLVPLDVKGWKYGIAVELNFAGLSTDALNGGKPIPPIVVERLNQFTSNDFKISHLFADFTSTELARFDPEETSVGDNPPEILTAFVSFMTNFLKGMKDDPKTNPYILGYTITKDKDTPNPDQDVPLSLKPIGQTFALYKDPKVPNMSNINFILNTQGGQGKLSHGIHPTPGIFDENWIEFTEKCNGKMIYSSHCLLETLLLKPFYESYSRSSYNNLKGAGLDISQPPAFASASSSNGYSRTYKISDVTSGSNQYQNSFTVSWNTTSEGISLDFKGHIFAKKTVTREQLCTAVAWATGYVDWSSSIKIAAQKDSKGKPIVTISPPVAKIDDNGSNSDMNTCAKVWDVIGKIIGAILEALTLGLGQGFFIKLFSELLTPQVGAAPNPVTCLQNLSSSINGSFMLPAGQVFFFKNAAMDPLGDISLQLTYKTETYGFENDTYGFIPDQTSSLFAADERFDFIDTPHSRIAKLKAGAIMPPGPEQAPAVTEPVESLQSQNLSAPLIDKIKLSLPDKNKQCDVSVSCELMTAVTEAMPVSGTAEMYAVQNAAGGTMLFTIGPDQKPRTILSTSGSTASGFTVVDLLDGTPKYEKALARALAVSQDTKGQISLALALSEGSDGTTDILFVDRVANAVTEADLKKVLEKAFVVKGVDSAFTVENLSLGTSDDSHRPILTISGRLKKRRFFYQLQAEATEVQQMELPENVNPDQNHLIGLKTGFAFGRRANYFLYEIGETKSLVALTVATENGSSLAFDYSPGNTDIPEDYRNLTYNSIAVSTGQAHGKLTTSDLYVSAPTGVYRIPGGKASLMEQVTADIKDAHEISVTSTADSISLWVTASPNYLYYIYGRRSDTANGQVRWNPPFKFATNALHVCAVRNAVTDTNEVFTVNQDASIAHYWQDPNSTNWYSKKASVKGKSFVVDQRSYTSHIQVVSDGIPLSNFEAKITSSEWQYCIINGLMYSLDIDTPAIVTTDPFGKITIIGPANDSSPPVLHIQSDSFSETINIYPNGKIQHYLRKVKDGNDLRSARTQDGKPVLDQSLNKDLTDSIAANISSLGDSVGSQFPPIASNNIFVSVEGAAGAVYAEADGFQAKHTFDRKFNISHIPDGPLVCMSTENGEWVNKTDNEASLYVGEITVQGIIDDLTKFAGDVWHFLENFANSAISYIKKGIVYLKDGISFVIQKAGEGLSFILTIAGKGLRILLDTVGKVFKAINWVLKLIGIDLSKILAWFGHLIGWDKVWATHKVLSGAMSNLMTHGGKVVSKYIDIGRQEVHGLFDDLNVKIREGILPESVKSRSLQSMKTAETGAAQDVFMSPQGSYAFNLLQNAGISNRSATQLQASNDHKKLAANDLMTSFYEEVLEPAFNTIVKSLNRDVEDLVNLFTSGSVDQLRVLVADIADGIIDVIATIVDGFMKFFQTIISFTIDTLVSPLDIPVLQALWDFITGLFGGQEELTAINAISLLIALPTTTICTILGKPTPDKLNQGFDAPDFPEKLEEAIKNSFKQDKKAEFASDLASEKLEDSASVAPMGRNIGEEILKAWSYFANVLGPVAGSVANFGDVAMGRSDGGIAKDLSVMIQGAGATKAFLSLPIRDGEPIWAYLLRWVAWLISTGGQCWRELGRMGRAVVNAVVLVLAIVIDIGSDSSVLNWVSDISGSAGGFIADAFTDPYSMTAGTILNFTSDLTAFINAFVSIMNSKVNNNINVGGC
ncbi:hypothetical protein TWF730_009302 [Orbilia blumenaviensis]|uniref:Uncharacterized protein n=1 Tax=Orbilia blumenaviensis TaxID=1796055 RepID=A0AAV9UXW9_9PEZI